MGKRDREDEDDDKQAAIKIPVAVVNEQAVIAAAFSSRRCRSVLAKKGIRVEHFGEEKHRAIWGAILELEHRGLDNDVAAVQSLASKADARLLGQIADARPDEPTKENVKLHVDGLFWDAARVNVAEGPLPRLLEALKDPDESPERVRAAVRQMAAALDGFGSRAYIRDSADVVADLVEDLERRRRETPIWPFGIKYLDEFEEDHPERKKGRRWRVAPGLDPGGLTVITSVTSMGKTTCAANIVLGQLKRRRRVLWGVWEDTDKMNLEKIVAIYLGLSRTDLRLGLYDDETLAAISRVASNMAPMIEFFGLPFGRDVGKKPSNDRNIDVVYQHVADSGCDLFVADVWNRCLVDRSPEGEENAIIRTQAIALETKCHIIATHQQRFKEVEKREDFRPTREGAKGSGALIEAPDNVFGIHRPDFFKPVAKKKLEIHALKRRHGPAPWAVEFDFDDERGIISGGRTVPHEAGPSRKRRKAADEFGTDDEDG